MTRARWALLVAAAGALLAIGLGAFVLSRPYAPGYERRSKFAPLGPRFPGGPLSCTVHADCTLTRDVDGECCSTDCGPYGTAYSRAFVDALNDEIKRACVGAPCPNVMCGVPTESHAALYAAARCLGGQCGQVPFTWSNARIADVTVAGEHVRIQFESNGLRLTVREDGISYGDSPDVHPYSVMGPGTTGLVSRWRAERPSAKEWALPGVEAKIAREKLELPAAVDRLIADLEALPTAEPPPPAPSAASSSSSRSFEAKPLSKSPPARRDEP